MPVIDGTNGVVQGAVVASVIAFVGVVIAALAGVAAAIFAARIGAGAARHAADTARSEAQADRLEARQARLAVRTLELASAVLAGSERHKHEVGLQFRSWTRAASEGLNPDGVIPDVAPIQDILDAVGGLYIVASQETADAAWGLYMASRDGLDEWAYVAERHRHGNVVDLPAQEHFEAINAAFLHFDVAKTVFLDQVRMELGQKPLVQSRPPFPVVAGEE